MGGPSPATTSTLPAPSALQAHLQNSIDPTSPHPPHLQHLAQQIAHNLQYQHNWTDVVVHHSSPDSKSSPFPRPLISGLPPLRLYTHPDEQVALLRKAKAEGTTESDDLAAVAKLSPPEREWVLPSHLKEEWSLRRFGEVFDQIGVVPPAPDGKEGEVNPWRTKRIVLATLDDDSTVVYYIVHDGIVKPRQN
ncbi:hypothetical protein K461DRAFT_289119 [Myriangium duriaei CBS 260.36]|uniref:tRNA-splicing endonuclease subunit Sen15 domain-containing protein n=1 Tax=Myriangium duriaei CBS 260.36 TaxID=1168546 RepID=A0A9P4JCZ3_9PEZI|nr:hypothetical protein K461DRAFT_289119 [Myriangium duriaei CBS 260.36]